MDTFLRSVKQSQELEKQYCQSDSRTKPLQAFSTLPIRIHMRKLSSLKSISIRRASNSYIKLFSTSKLSPLKLTLELRCFTNHLDSLPLKSFHIYSTLISVTLNWLWMLEKSRFISTLHVEISRKSTPTCY